MAEQDQLILKTLLDLVARVEEMDTTLHNGLSHKTTETHELVMQLSKDFAEYKTIGRLVGCPYVVDKEHRMNHRKRMTTFTKGFLAFLTLLGGTLATWFGITQYLGGI